MKTLSHTIKDPQGIHVRPAGMLVKQISEFSSRITIKKGEKSVDAKRMLSIMSLGAKKGDELLFEIEGEDEEQACVALETFLSEHL